MRGRTSRGCVDVEHVPFPVYAVIFLTTLLGIRGSRFFGCGRVVFAHGRLERVPCRLSVGQPGCVAFNIDRLGLDVL